MVITQSGTKVLDTGESQYPVIVSWKVEQKYQKIQSGLAYWRVYPQFQNQHLVFQVVSVSEEPKSEPGRFILQGDLVNQDQIQIWRNPDSWRVNAKNLQPRLLPISWQDTPPADGGFWQLQAELVDGTFEITQAIGPFPHPPRIEALPQFKHYNHNQQQKQPRHQASAKQQSLVASEIINWEELIAVSGKLELTIKINSLPQVQTANGICHFKVECDGRMVQIALRQKQWTKLETANTTYAEWIAAISGKMGAVTSDGFVLEESNVQVFERKSKATTQNEQVLPDLGSSQRDAEPVPETGKEMTQVKPETLKPESESLDADKLRASQKKPADSAKANTSNLEQTKSKKVGKFNVQIR